MELARAGRGLILLVGERGVGRTEVLAPLLQVCTADAGHYAIALCDEPMPLPEAGALFATLQQTAAKGAGLDPTLLVAANTSGGVVGKMISPQNLTIAATAVGLVGRESDIFRKVILWSVGLIIVMCLLVGLQSTVLAWMLPEFVKWPTSTTQAPVVLA